VRSENLLFQQLNRERIDIENVQYYIDMNNKAPENLRYSFRVTDNDKERSFLHYAAMHGHTKALSMLIVEIREEIIKKHEGLAEYNKVINGTDNDGKTALHLACQNGHPDTVKCLLENGVDVFFPTQDGEEPLIVAIKHYTEEEKKDDEKLRQRIQTIKILLESNAGIGTRYLVELFKKTKKIGLIPALAVFGDVNVIGSGLARNYSGFELAVCNIAEYQTNIIDPHLNNINHLARKLKLVPSDEDSQPESPINAAIEQSDKQCQQLISLCQKRLGQFASLECPQAIELRRFIKRLDLLMSGSLKRLCMRFTLENTKKIIEAAKTNKTNLQRLGSLLPGELVDTIELEIKKMNQKNNLDAVRQVLQNLQNLNENIQNSPIRIRERSHYRIATIIRNIVIIIRSPDFLMLCGLFLTALYGITITALGVRSVGFPMWLTGVGACASFFPSFAIAFFFVALFPSHPTNRQRVYNVSHPDISNFHLPLHRLEDTVLQHLADVQNKIIELKVAGIIPDNVAAAFVNSRNTDSLKTAVECIIEKCRRYLNDHSGNSNTLFAANNTTHSSSRESDNEQSDDDEWIEISTSGGDETTPLLMKGR